MRVPEVTDIDPVALEAWAWSGGCADELEEFPRGGVEGGVAADLWAYMSEEGLKEQGGGLTSFRMG